MFYQNMWICLQFASLVRDRTTAKSFWVDSGATCRAHRSSGASGASAPSLAPTLGSGEHIKFSGYFPQFPVWIQAMMLQDHKHTHFFVLPVHSIIFSSTHWKGFRGMKVAFQISHWYLDRLLRQFLSAKWNWNLSKNIYGSAPRDEIWPVGGSVIAIESYVKMEQNVSNRDFQCPEINFDPLVPSCNWNLCNTWMSSIDQPISAKVQLRFI